MFYKKICGCDSIALHVFQQQLYIPLVSSICNSTARNPCHSKATCKFIQASIVQCTCQEGYEQGGDPDQGKYGTNVTNPEGTNCTGKCGLTVHNISRICYLWRLNL